MVVIGKDFNREMDEYLSERRKGSKSGFFSETTRGGEKDSWFSKVFSSKKSREEVEVPESLAEEGEEIEVVEEEIEPEDTEEDKTPPEEEPEPVRESLLSKFLKKLGFGKNLHRVEEERIEAEAQQEKNEEFRKDFREFAKIAHKWVEKLPSEKKKEFKRKEEFQKYKEILEKHGLLK